MIKYNLKCVNKHEFESWFSNSKEFEKLKSKKLIECLYCKTKTVDKSIMSPQVLSKEEKSKQKEHSENIKKVKKNLLKLENLLKKTLKMSEIIFQERLEMYIMTKEKIKIYMGVLLQRKLKN